MCDDFKYPHHIVDMVDDPRWKITAFRNGFISAVTGERIVMTGGGFFPTLLAAHLELLCDLAWVNEGYLMALAFRQFQRKITWIDRN